MKSVVRSGMNSRWVCVPSIQPRPHSPPEPTAMVDWMMWNPLPSGSLLGSSSVITRCRWESCISDHSSGAEAAAPATSAAITRQLRPARKIT